MQKASPLLDFLDSYDALLGKSSIGEMRKLMLMGKC